MPKSKAQQLTNKDMEKLLSQQTTVILDSVDYKIKGVDKRLDGMDKRFDIVDKRMDSLEQKLNKMEININQKFDHLITTLDKFLKRMTDLEEDFEMMKADLKRVKKVIKDKLGVDII